MNRNTVIYVVTDIFLQVELVSTYICYSEEFTKVPVVATWVQVHKFNLPSGSWICKELPPSRKVWLYRKHTIESTLAEWISNLSLAAKWTEVARTRFCVKE
jgi:hypothetical protein